MSAPHRLSRTLDEWIALRCQAGEQQGFEDLVALMERPILYYATKLTGNAETALDIVQNVWIKVFRGIRSLKDPASLRPWLYRVAHGMAVDHIRQDISRDRAEEAHAAGFNEAADVSFTGDDAAAIHEALNDLQPKTPRSPGLVLSRRLLPGGNCHDRRVLRRDREIAYPLCKKSDEGNSDRRRLWNEVNRLANYCCRVYRDRRT